MSYVYNVILLTSCSEEVGFHYPAVRFMNDKLLSEGMVELMQIYTDTAGGNKQMEILMFGAAFSFFDAAIIARVAQITPWINPDSAQLIAKGQDDLAFWRLYGPDFVN